MYTHQQTIQESCTVTQVLELSSQELESSTWYCFQCQTEIQHPLCSKQYVKRYLNINIGNKPQTKNTVITPI